MNQFTFVGKLNLGKETEKFKPIKTSKSASGWLGTRVNFSLFNNTGYHNLEMFEGYFENGSSLIYCLGKDKGADNKYPKMQVKWADRLKQEIVDSVASFNKYVIEIGEVKKEFIAGYDFLQEVIAILKDEKYKEQKFKVDGDVVYNVWNGKTYRKFVPKSIVAVTSETPDESTVKLDLYYTQGAVQELQPGKYSVDAYVRQYDSTTKGEIAFKQEVFIDATKAQTEKHIKAFDLIKSRFVVTDETFMKLGVKAVMINGRQKVDIKFEDLSDEEKDLIELGLATFEEIANEYGGTMNGDMVSEIKVVGFSYGYNRGAQKTDFTYEDFMPSDVTDEIIDDTYDNAVVDELDDDLPF